MDVRLHLSVTMWTQQSGLDRTKAIQECCFGCFIVYVDVLLNMRQETLTAGPSVVVVVNDVENIAAELELYTRLPSAVTNPE